MLAKKSKCVQQHPQNLAFSHLALGVTILPRGVRAADAKPRYWAGLNFRWAWAGSGPEVPSPGNPAGLVNVLSRLPDFHQRDPSSHWHHGNQSLSTQNLGMDLPLAARS